MVKSLSFLLRPNSLDNIVGQTHLLNKKNGIIYKMKEKNFITNIIFYGPPGIGKTSMAISLANDLNLEYICFNAANDKKDKLLKIVENSKNKKIVLLIDEIHRMNRNIQDFLLEFIESREITVFLTTTENPFFVINPAIRSRCTIMKLNNITLEEMQDGLVKILKNNHIDLQFEKDAFEHLCNYANGDLRVAINAIEIIFNLYKDQKIDVEIINAIFNKSYIRGSGVGDEFHDLKSALQKSIRGSDVNAALHYWSRLMELGDYETLMRRMIIIAYEDVGLANPAIATRVYQACEVFRKVGMPEGRLVLGMAIIEMALSEKSNSSYLAINEALDDVDKGNTPPIPNFLRDTSYKNAKELGYGLGYKYPHNFENDWVEQQYLPNEIKNREYFKFKPHSAYEKKLKEIYYKFTNKK
ncbi:replication-associated recombination protein A [Spiroplasma apis]|uniref:Recombination factor protein RarA n=1 Tax=Spiroplasma apis B31 TaxID=1276258 RepID=V5RK81_SPIAP|nr:replication-associated recombination protein A [Spiroplasma apis]AHB36215.1 recombination factor protein RarA [Spiroplasma apis B31]